MSRPITTHVAAVFPALATADDTVWAQARGLAAEAAGLLLQSVPWQTPMGYDRNAVLAKYPWGTYGFYGQLVAADLGGPIPETVPRAYHLQAVLSFDPTPSDLQLHAAMTLELAHALGRATGTADLIEHAIEATLTDRVVGIQAEADGPVVAHAHNYVMLWPINAEYLRTHPELAALRRV